MATEKASSFLAGVKEELTGRFAESYDSLASDLDEEPMTTVGAELQKLQKDTWTLMEKKLKESYLNGKKAGTSKESKAESFTVSEGKGPRTNPFRR